VDKTISRRGLLQSGGAVAALSVVAGKLKGTTPVDFPLVDYHVHLDEVFTLENALQLSTERRVKFGIVEHAGTRENKYRGLLSSDEDLERYIATLDGKPVYKGVQAEGLDWMTCFSRGMVSRLDYVLSDALTFPEKNGQRVELWQPWVKIEDKQDFMDRYTDFNVQVIVREPIDILANPTFLPTCLQSEYDELWTLERMKRVIEVAVKHRVAIEINSRYRIPRLPFLRIAGRAGVKFSFGSNTHGLGAGKLEYCLEAAKQLGLKPEQMFTPAPPGKKPIEVRKFT
jgi:histidinol phosphatase-like PHP family hydrolase